MKLFVTFIFFVLVQKLPLDYFSFIIREVCEVFFVFCFLFFKGKWNTNLLSRKLLFSLEVKGFPWQKVEVTFSFGNRLLPGSTKKVKHIF